MLPSEQPSCSLGKQPKFEIIIDSAHCGDDEEILNLFPKEPKPSTSDHSANHEIFSMSKTGNLNRIKDLMTTIRDPKNFLDSHGNSMLYYACLCGQLNVVRYLSDLGHRDDKYGRCFLNALSLDVRRMLKLYNNYKSHRTNAEQGENGMEVEDDLEYLMKSYAMKSIYEESVSFKKRLEEETPLISCETFLSESENPKDDILLRMIFKGSKSVAEYKCSKWVLLSRWPQLALFGLEQSKKKQRKKSAEHTLITSEFVKLLTSPNMDLFPFNLSNEQLEQISKNKKSPKFGKKVSILKNEQKEIKDRFKFTHIPTLTEINNELQKQANLEKFSKEFLTIVDFGVVPFERKYFETVLVWLYCGKLINPQQKNSKIIYLEENFITSINGLTQVAHSLQIRSLAEHIKNSLFTIIPFGTTLPCQISKKMDQDLADIMKAQLKADFNPLPICIESNDKLFGVDYLKRLTFNMALTFKSENPSQKTERYLCNKQFLMDRSIFFDVIVNCEFSDGQEFRKQEANNEIPQITIEQCNNQKIMEQVVAYLSSETIKPTNQNVIDLWSIAHLLNLQKLASICEEYISYNISKDETDMYQLYKLAQSIGSAKLKTEWERQTLVFLKEQVKLGNLDSDKVLEELNEMGLDPEVIHKFKIHIAGY